MQIKPGVIDLATKESLEKHSIYMENVDSFDEFRSLVPECGNCPLKRDLLNVSTTLLPRGPEDVKVVIVLRNPHPTEIDRGQILAKGSRYAGVVGGMLRIMGIRWWEVYLTYAAFCSTPGDRIPHQGEVENCSGWKTWELQNLPNVKYILTLGIDATKQILGWKTPQVGKIFWDVFKCDLNGRDVFVFPCHHPRYFLQNDDFRLPIIEWCGEVGDFISQQEKKQEKKQKKERKKK